MMEQVPLTLPPREPYSLQYFVSHSGVAAAVELLEHAWRSCLEGSISFQGIFLLGPKGVGKTHLAKAYEALALRAQRELEIWDLGGEPRTVESEDEIRGYISHFERIKSKGGILLVCSRQLPLEVSQNPHLSSRLLATNLIELSLPREEELHSLFASVLERWNLRLSSRNIELLLKRIPRNPLSFATISARISHLSLTQGKPASMKLLIEALRVFDVGDVGPDQGFGQNTGTKENNNE